jgi:hypothetical protein
MGATLHSVGTVQRSGTTVRSRTEAFYGGLIHELPPPSIAASFIVRYPELHVMKRYLVNSPLL